MLILMSFDTTNPPILWHSLTHHPLDLFKYEPLGDCLIGQFDAIFSLNKRRNEVWVPLATHPWEKKTK